MERLVSFWSGKPSWIERTCVSSTLAQGHPLTLYSYTPDTLRNEFDTRVQIVDARSVLALSADVSRQLASRPALTANLIRYKLQQMSAGTWVDLDMLLLKPMPANIYTMAYEDQANTWINNAVLRLPPDSPLLCALIEFCMRRPVVAPWWPLSRRLKHRIRAAVGRPIPPEKCRWGVFGPRALTYFAKELGLEDRALPANVFYPVPYGYASAFLDPGFDVAGHLTSDTIGVHLWANKLRKHAIDHPPSSTSWLGRQVAMHSELQRPGGIDVATA